LELPFGGSAPTGGAEEGVERLSGDIATARSEFDRALADFSPDVVFALTDIGAQIAAESAWKGPLYVDYNGHPMTERAEQCRAHGNNTALAAQWLGVLPVLLRADRFSVVSWAQRAALLGELGVAGRLNAETCHHDLVDVLPPNLPFQLPLEVVDAKRLQSFGVPAEAPVILSTGGFNTWMDEATLFAALERVFASHSTARFLATGGGIPGHVEIVYERFQAAASASPFAARYHFAGWIEHEAFLDCLQLATVAVNSEHASLEGEFGFRNRLLGWAWGGLGIVTHVTGEATARLVGQGFARAVPTADAAALAEALLQALEAGRPGTDVPRRTALLQEWSGAREFAAILEWARNPTIAPDRAASGRVENPLVDFQRQALAPGGNNQVGELVARLRGSTAFSLLLSTNPALRTILEAVERSFRK